MFLRALVRHVPTAVYIDTEVFMSQGLRFDTNQFNKFRETFVKGGIRLLIPKMMERELLRKFSQQATNAAGKLIKAHNEYPINSLSLMEVPSEGDLVSKGYQAIFQQWNMFKEHFHVEELPIVGNLEDVIDWYFEIEPPFSEGKPKEFPDAFIISTLEIYHKEHKTNIAVVSNDGDFRKACARYRYIEHYSKLDDYIDAFRPEPESKHLEPPTIDPTIPITVEDLTELKAILGHGNVVTDIKIQRALKLIESRGTNYEYFFRNATNEIWLEHLISNGYFENPPVVEITVEGGYRTPLWLPINYLVRIYEAKPDVVLKQFEMLPATKNTHILESIMDVVLKADTAAVVDRLSSKILSFIDESVWIRHEKIIQLLKKPFLFDRQLADFTSLFINKLVGFLPDPKAEEKQSNRTKYPDDPWMSHLQPLPRFDQWVYEEILEKGIRPLTERAPHQVVYILINATSSMLRMNKYPGDLDEEGGEDESEYWCRRLNQPDTGHRDIEASLVHTLTFACEKVYEKSPETVIALDEALRNQDWKLFKRLRQHLYSLHPNEQTLPWIREFILEHQNYSERGFSFEFQIMLRKSCEYFGTDLLSEQERTAIFDSILRGPSIENFRERLGDEFTDDKFQQRRRYFHRKQLRPFARLLTGEYQGYFQELERLEKEPLADDDYSPVRSSEGGVVSFRSPRSLEDLAALSDTELLEYINEWEDEQLDKGDWLNQINIEGLAGEYQTLFKDTIIPNEDRLAYLLENRDKIQRPIYVEAIIKAIQEDVKEQHFEQLDLWFDLCEWVISHPDIINEDAWEFSDGSRASPNWRNARRAVVNFLGVCLRIEDFPFEARDSLGSILKSLCTQFDGELAHDEPLFLSRNDQITEAINNTRGRSLEELIKFGVWVRIHNKDDAVSEVTSTLEERIKPGAEFPLTMPEYALLGMYYMQLYNFDHSWAVRHKIVFFPQKNIQVWQEAFGSFLRFNRPSKISIEILREDYEFSLMRLGELKEFRYFGLDRIDTLGQHLFSYYLWQIYPLSGKDSLLEKFYEKTTGDWQRWAGLFDHVGRSLRNSGRHLDEGLEKRIVDFFEWRLENKKPQELQEFTFWLVAECLSAEWRLNAYSRVLDVMISNYEESSNSGGMIIPMVLEKLRDMLEEHTFQVMECFAKITDYGKKNNSIYLQSKKIQPILKAGLESDDETVRINAERAQENLLNMRRFDVLDIWDG